MTKLSDEIIKALSAREDVWLDDAAAPDGSPDIRGVQLRRFKESSVVGPDSYHPFQRLEWVYVGQSFAIETELKKGAKPLNLQQLQWRDDFEAVGGLYIEAHTMADVVDALGVKEPQPWAEFLDRVTRVGKVLNAQG